MEIPIYRQGPGVKNGPIIADESFAAFYVSQALREILGHSASIHKTGSTFLPRFLDDWENWFQQTKGRRVECQRHHLSQRLSHYGQFEIRAVIALASLGKKGGACPEACREATALTRSLESVIHEYHGRFREFVERGIVVALDNYELQAEKDRALVEEIKRSTEQEVQDECA